MAGAAVRGTSKILRKGLRKTPVLGGRVKGAPTFTLKRRIIGGLPKPKAVTAKQTKKKPIISDIEKGIFIGGAGTLAVQQALKKQNAVKAEGKAKEKKAKKALTRALGRHKKSTKETKGKRGKHHG